MVISALASAHAWSDDEAAAMVEIVQIRTSGDRIQDRPLADIGGKGLFAKELEEALLSDEIDCAVHSLKDMPAVLPNGLIIECVLQREDPSDAFLSPHAAHLRDLPIGAVIGSSSVRRQAMILNVRPDIKVVTFRGNVETRLRKLAAGETHATLLALAGLRRLGLHANVQHVFSSDEMLPAVAQGAIGIEVRDSDTRIRDVLLPISHTPTASAVALERAFLEVLDGSCKTPIAGLAEWSAAGGLEFRGCALSPDGRIRYDISRSAGVATIAQAVAAGRDAGEEMLARAGRAFFQV
jgi:hydroxymethylbilane synthase